MPKISGSMGPSPFGEGKSENIKKVQSTREFKLPDSPKPMPSPWKPPHPLPLPSEGSLELWLDNFGHFSAWMFSLASPVFDPSTEKFIEDVIALPPDTLALIQKKLGPEKGKEFLKIIDMLRDKKAEYDQAEEKLPFGQSINIIFSFFFKIL